VIGSGYGVLAAAGYGAAATVGFTGAGLLVGGTSAGLYASEGQYVHAGIDVVATLLPFAFKGVRVETRGAFSEFWGRGYSGNTFKPGASFTKVFTEARQELSEGRLFKQDLPAWIKSWRQAGRLASEARAAEPGVTSDMTAVAEEVGGSMEGLENRLKTRSSLTRKIGDAAVEELASPESTSSVTEVVNQQASEINDALRYTMKFSEPEYTGGVDATLSALEKRGYTVTRHNNAWTQTGVNDSGYRGLNTTLRSPEGQILELQFHTDASLQWKTSSHPVYEEWRRMQVGSPEWERLRAIQAEEGRKIPIPTGVEKFKSRP
jgi:hypothetical protein